MGLPPIIVREYGKIVSGPDRTSFAPRKEKAQKAHNHLDRRKRGNSVTLMDHAPFVSQKKKARKAHKYLMSVPDCASFRH